MKNKDLFIKGMFWFFWSMVLAICVFFIVKNAHWVIGDDAIVMEHTGSGKPFLFSHMINRSVGRFCPLAYMAYNVLLLFFDGRISPKSHYVLEAFFFVIFAVAFTILLLQMLKNNTTIWKYPIAFFAFLLCIGRVYPQYVECFSTAWCSYTLTACFLLFSFLLHEYQNWAFGIVTLLFANLICYSSELGFVLPLGIGGFGLLFYGKTLSKVEKLFNWLMIGSALLFLTIYLVFIVPYVEHYGTHVIGTSVIGNALRMFIAQKIIVVGFVVFMIRIVSIVWKKQPFEYSDAFLLTAFADFCACAILKLDWTLYYNGAALLCIPSILSCFMKYLKSVYVLVFVGAIGAFYGMKIPKAIKHSQEHRVSSYGQVVKLANAISNGVVTYWWMPNGITDDFQYIIRYCQRGWLASYLIWHLNEDIPVLNQKAIEGDSVCSGIWLMSLEDRDLFIEEIDTAIDREFFFMADGICGFLIDDGGVFNDSKK